MGLFDGYFDPAQFADSGGLLTRLLSLQQQQGQFQPGAGFDQAPSGAPAPAAPSAMLANNGQAPVFPPGQQPSRNAGNMVSAGYNQPVISDASRDPVRPGSQYAQAMGLCAAGPAGCAAGAGLTLGQLILGGTALGGLGGIILKNQDHPSDPGDKPASTPTGKRGYEINVISGTNQPASIGGRIYTGHAADQMQARGIPPSAVEDAIQNGQVKPGNEPGTTLHIGTNGVKVVTGSNDQIITVIPGDP